MNMGLGCLEQYGIDDEVGGELCFIGELVKLLEESTELLGGPRVQMLTLCRQL